jgi:hypothetical protein
MVKYVSSLSFMCTPKKFAGLKEANVTPVVADQLGFSKMKVPMSTAVVPVSSDLLNVYIFYAE